MNIHIAITYSNSFVLAVCAFIVLFMAISLLNVVHGSYQIYLAYQENDSEDLNELREKLESNNYSNLF